MANMYKAMFMEVLEKDDSISWITDRSALLKAVRYKKWNVYAKAPFGSPAQVVEYLGRYLPSGRRVHTKSPSPDTGYLK